MGLRTIFTELMTIEHPIVLAPMGGSAGGELAAAVSNGGGLGLVGGGRGDPDWLLRELAVVTARTEKPWGVGFLSWSATREVVELALRHRPRAVMLSFGDPKALVEPVLEAGVRLIVQVTDVEEAQQAIDLGADVIVAQGAEAGGHGGMRATLPFVPIVVDLAGATPVLAAGGVADGRGLAAAICLGAAGVLVGTRFQASPEALVEPGITQAILAGSGADTERSRILDIARGAPWPPRYPGRALRNDFLERWRGREDELAADQVAQAEYRKAVADGDMSAVAVWASDAIDLIDSVVPAAELVGLISDQAEAALTKAGRSVVRASP